MTTFLIDMDGTLVSSHGVVEASWTAFAQENGLDPAEVIAYCHGRPGRDTLLHFLGDEQRAVSEAEAMMRREATITEGIVEIPGAKEFVDAIEPGHWALVTSASRELATVRLAQVGITAPQVMVCYEDITRGKPDPQPYLLGAERMGVDIADCVVLEDSAAGVRSGMASGATTVVVGPLPGFEELQHVPDLAGVRPADLIPQR